MPKFGPAAVLLSWSALFGWSDAATLSGTVSDASGAPAPSAAVELFNPQSGFALGTLTGPDGTFRMGGIPEDAYRLRVSLPGFLVHSANIAVRAAVPAVLSIRLELSGQRTSVTVEANPDRLAENRAIASGTVDRRLLAALPTVSPGSALNDAIVSTTPGIAADSNGFFHPLGDHAQVSYVIDGQPVSDQRNKVFATSIPASAIQSMDVIPGWPAAEYGDKTSLVIEVATRSGLGQKPSGSLLANYGSFGTAGAEATLGFGSARWGNFVAVDATRSGRFLDTPEFWPMHDTGNSGTIFDRIDFQSAAKHTFHLALMAARNWTQVPVTYDQPLQDQKQKVAAFNIAPGYERAIGARALFAVNAFVRRDGVDFFPSHNPLDDTPATLAQDRSLANLGVRTVVSGMTGRHNWKAGLHASQTRLDEEFSLGITDPAYNDPRNANFLPALLQYDLSRGGSPYRFRGGANINQFACFAQDAIALGALTLNVGIRFDRYNGLADAQAAQPRASFSYLFRPTRTLIRGGYSRTMETPANENLVASSSTGPGGLAGNLFQGEVEQKAIVPGTRNQYDAGVQQSLWRWVVLDVNYFRKYTRNAFDFDTLFSTPVTFPIGWRQSKLDGISARVSTIELRGLRVYATMGHANARFFGPENGGLIFNSNLSVGAYRQDHDQVYQQNVNIQYRHAKSGWRADFTWRYDSGLVVGAVNNLDDALSLTADQQNMIGFWCGGERASQTHRIAACSVPDYGATRIRIPAPGTDNADHNPPRTGPRNILSLGVGTENLFHTERIHTTLRFTVVNLTNQAAMYNFLSPFGGTHWAAPRTFQMQAGIAF